MRRLVKEGASSMSIISLIAEADACRADLIELSRQMQDISEQLRSIATAVDFPEEAELNEIHVKGTLAKLAEHLAEMRRLRLNTRLNRNAGLKARVEMEAARA